MQNLKNKLIFILPLLVAACQSAPVFDIETFAAPPGTKLDDHHVIRIESNRIKQECLFLNAEAENKWRHQYFMYLLTNKNEVLPVMYAINQDGKSCQKQLTKIQKILDQEAQVKVCANSDLKKAANKIHSDEPSIYFGRLGNHKVDYEALFLDSICNSKDCFIYNKEPTCSR